MSRRRKFHVIFNILKKTPAVGQGLLPFRRPGPHANRPWLKSGRMRGQFLEKLMTLLKFSDVSLAFGSMPLLDKVSWQIARGERVCIIGRNGTGKSSMMKLVKGDQKPDDGSVW